MASKTRTNGRKAKQGFIEGMEPPRIKEIDAKADELYEVRFQRMKLTEEETRLADELLSLMRQHKLKTYETPDGKNVEVASLDKVRVRRPKIETTEKADE